MNEYQVNPEFDIWFVENLEELEIEAAELGLDREPDFCFEDWCEEKFFGLFPE